MDIREIDSQVIAVIQAPELKVQLVRSWHPSPCDTIHREADHIIALQRQRRQIFSSGRFAALGADPDYHDIGRLLLVPADTPLEIRAEGGETLAVRCCFTQTAFVRATGRETLVTAEDLVGCLDIKSPIITQILARLADEVEAPGFASAVLAESFGTALMIELARYIHDIQPRPAVQRGGLSRRTHRQIIEYVESVGGTPSLSDLSHLTGLSRRHLTRAFRQTTGQTIHSYIDQVRFKHASSLLADSNYLIKDIAFKLGFTCSSSFSVAFRRQAGESPYAFRKRMRPTIFSMSRPRADMSAGPREAHN